MDELDLLHCIDFLDIALEQLEADDPETAKDFVEDVQEILQEEHDG